MYKMKSPLIKAELQVKFLNNDIVLYDNVNNYDITKSLLEPLLKTFEDIKQSSSRTIGIQTCFLLAQIVMQFFL